MTITRVRCRAISKTIVQPCPQIFSPAKGFSGATLRGGLFTGARCARALAAGCSFTSTAGASVSGAGSAAGVSTTAAGCSGVASVSGTLAAGLDLAVEEIFANIANYAYYPQTGKVTIHGCLTRECCKITLSFEDRGKPFNPLEKKAPDLEPVNGKRQIGGLGIFLTRKMVDDIQYEYRDGKNILTLYKYMTGETPYPR